MLVHTKFFVTSGVGNTLFQLKAYCELIDDSPKSICFLLYKKNFFTSLLDWSFHINLINFDNLRTSNINYCDIFALIILFFKKKFHPDQSFYKLNFFKYSWIFGYHQNVILCDYDKKFVFDYLNFDVISSSLKCTCHVRWGDFSLKERLSVEYYVDAISLAVNLGYSEINFIGLGSEELLLLIPDDLRSRCKYIGGSEQNDFRSLFNSELIIASNSSFCLWASLFGNSKTIIFNNRVNELFKFNVAKNILWITD